MNKVKRKTQSIPLTLQKCQRVLHRDIKDFKDMSKYIDDGFHLYQDCMRELPATPSHVAGKIQFMFYCQLQMSRLLYDTVNHLDATLRVLEGEKGTMNLKVRKSIHRELQAWFTEREMAKNAQRQYIR
ncbi:MAG: hypothetical protein ABSB53_03270 [Nitrososphaerales archaeon]|jgi:hypothetical protein